MADVHGGSGNNNWTSGSTNIRYFDGDANDAMYGDSGTNVLYPSAHPNANGEWIYGSNGDDLYFGAGSNDYIVGYETDTGKDSMIGELGSDSLYADVVVAHQFVRIINLFSTISHRQSRCPR